MKKNEDFDQITSEFDFNLKKNFNTNSELKPKTIKEKVFCFGNKLGLCSLPERIIKLQQKQFRYIFFNYDLSSIKVPNFDSIIKSYPRNKIKTTKFTPLTFLPMNIISQFYNVANFFFLILGILNMFPIFGASSRVFSLLPLVFIIMVTCIKDAFENYQHAVNDSEINNANIILLTGLKNPNFIATNVGAWRSFKKLTSRTITKVKNKLYCLLQHVFSKNAELKNISLERKSKDYLRKVSIAFSESSHNSIFIPSSSSKVRRSFHSSRFKQQLKLLPNSILNPNLRKKNQLSSAINARFKISHCKSIHVGDVIKVKANDEVPADIIILSCSDIEGLCSIETKNLDGETNLKTKKSLLCGGYKNIKHSSDLRDTKFWIECDYPNSDLYKFHGKIHYENFDENEELINRNQKEIITTENVLLRGSTLRNTRWVLGLVVYTGCETKIMLNSGNVRKKHSRITKDLNFSVITCFLFLTTLCLISSVVNGLYYNKQHVSRLFFEYLSYGSTSFLNGLLAFFVALILYQSLVPISLYISVEMVKSLQAFFIYSDLKMYYSKLDFFCVPRSWNLSDDLGQIEYIFSDKTGTLTRNVMEFKKCSINGKSYGISYTEAKKGLDKRDGLDVVYEAEKYKKLINKNKKLMIQNLKIYASNEQLREDNITFFSNEYVIDTLVPFEKRNDPKNNQISMEQMEKIILNQKKANEAFMLALALCHTVVTDNNAFNPEIKDFKAESPDEAALVSVARDLGFVFQKRSRKLLYLEIYGQKFEYELLTIIPFTSLRKKMSCIVKTPEKQYLLITKGSDNVIFKKLSPILNSEEMIHKTALHLEDYAKEGLRTLCIAQKFLNESDYQDWKSRYDNLLLSEDEDKEKGLNCLEDEMESNLILLGGTAIEDRLQVGVPDTINLLRKAGIKFWILTGDRIETAINIGFSCNILENNMKLLVVRKNDDIDDNLPHIDSLITMYLQENFNITCSNNDNESDLLLKISNMKKNRNFDETKFAIVIDGPALNIIFDDLGPTKSLFQKKLRLKFLLLGINCKSVICCRVSPFQKAEVVNLVKDNLDATTLSIGDGANDVAMIQAANVGVGIAGEEGRQAVISSDYSIGQFRFLARLLLVHGKWSYKRLSEMISCFFYKNVVFTLTCFFYGFFNDFDGSYLYEFTYLMFYNLAYTSISVIVLAIFDQDVPDTICLLVPELYRTGILKTEWSHHKFFFYIIDGIYQSIIAFFFSYFMYSNGFQNENGLSIDHRYFVGILTASIVIVSCNVYILLRQNRWDWVSLIFYSLSISLVFLWTLFWSLRENSGEFQFAGLIVYSNLSWWVCFFLGVITCVFPRFIIDFIKRIYFPKDIDIIKEKDYLGEYDNYPQGFDPTNPIDIEKHTLITKIIDNDPNFKKAIEGLEKNTNVNEDTLNPLSKNYKSSKKKTTFSRIRKDTINEQFKKAINLNHLRLQMISNGEYTTSSRRLERVDTTHELPGLTQAETLISYTNKNSLN